MPLIIDTFEVPASLISQRLFRCSDMIELKGISKKVIEMVLTNNDGIYFVHKECAGDEICGIKYYFNEIVEVFTNVQYINKNRKLVKYYVIGRNGYGAVCSLTEMKGAEESENPVDKTAFLPHLGAQEEEIVIFPDDED